MIVNANYGRGGADHSWRSALLQRLHNIFIKYFNSIGSMEAANTYQCKIQQLIDDIHLLNFSSCSIPDPNDEGHLISNVVDAPTRDRDGCISPNSINRSPTSSHLDSDINIKIGQLKEIYNEEFSKEDDSQRINFQTQTDLSYTGSQSCPSMTKLTKQGRRGMLVLQEQSEAYKGKGVQTINQKAYHELHERPSPTPFLQS